ncbi:MAG: hypothetical protein PHS33_09060 [Candidatus Omnitrophica bacterium]|nr:hypothetical protein [Candidatus Omnitrophota bacterium]
MNNRIIESKRNLKYEFTNDEKLTMGMEMANLDREIKLLQEEKKSANSNFQSRIDEKESRRTRLSNCVADGCEFRDIDCEVKYNSPKDGVKQVVRKDNNEVVEEIPMTAEEMQEEMEFQETRKLEAENKKENKRKQKAEKAGKEKSQKRQAMAKKKQEQKETK